MRIRSTARTAFWCQVGKSVLIQQENQKYRILNSRSEYNRCALPRLSEKLGKILGLEKEIQEEKKKEEELERKIRIMEVILWSPK